MPEPEVQQLHNIGPTVARWRVPDVIFFLYLSIGILSLGPCILFYFFRGSTPPATDEGLDISSENSNR